MIGRIPHWLLLAGIVTAGIGCDNVSWGGMSLSLEGPPTDTLPPPGTPGSESDADLQRIEYGPLLFAGIRQGDSAIVVPVAELVDGVLRPFPQGEPANRLAGQILEERLSPGQELTLYDLGARIGTLTVSSPLGTTTEYCPSRAEALGRIELIPSASNAQRFLALEKSQAPPQRSGLFRPMAPERAQRNAASGLAGEALNQLRAPWPASLQDIQQDLQVVQLSQDEAPSVVATFIFRDQLTVGPAPDDAYALMVLGEPRGPRFDRTFTWYRRVEEDGKGAPRVFSWMDWDGDGEEEILLEVLGAEARWWAALDREDAGWIVSFQDSCGGLEEENSAEDPDRGGAG